MKKNLLSLLLLSFLALSSAFAQSRKISGSVTSSEDGSPLPGVSVKVQGTTSGVQTDADGHYTLSIPTGQNVVNFSFIGYNNQSITIGAANTYNLKMVPN